MRKSAYLAVTATFLIAGAAMAAGEHGGGHDQKLKFGQPGKAAEATRTINVSANDQMRFVVDAQRIKVGETIKFVVKNDGKIVHEFSFGDAAYQRAHANMMKKDPNMSHDESPNAVKLQPGETKTLVWKFDTVMQGPLEMACFTPGHYEQGMKALIGVTK